MDILILSTKNPYPPRDGGAIATLNMALGLAKAGNTVTMLAMNTQKHYFEAGKIPRELRDHLRLVLVDADTSVHPAALLKNLVFSSEPYIAQRFNQPAFAEKLTELLVSEHFDVVQMEGPYLSAFLPLIRKHSEARVILRSHNIESEIWQRKSRNEKRLIEKIYFQHLSGRIRRLEKKLLKQVDVLVTISERDLGKLRKMGYTGPAMTVPTGLNLEDYEMAAPAIEHSIFFIGSLDWMPNQEGLVWFIDEVIPYLEKTKTRYTFHVAGRNAPQELVEKLQHPHIVYHGEVEDARAFMQRYEVMAVPLLTGSGIRIKIIEGMAMGKAIVTSVVGAEGIAATDRKHLFIAGEPETFAQDLILLLGNSRLREETAVEARNFIRGNFDTFTLSTRLTQFLTETL
ncbi:MAG: glycosyltransferase family 4 protein [Bacteroidota bacterium]